MDCGLRTTDFGLGIKHGLRTEYKTRTTVYVYKNSFRNVLKTERNGMWTSFRNVLKTERNGMRTSIKQ